jgi:hypothetical protein
VRRVLWVQGRVHLREGVVGVREVDEAAVDVGAAVARGSGRGRGDCVDGRGLRLRLRGLHSTGCIVGSRVRVGRWAGCWGAWECERGRLVRLC